MRTARVVAAMLLCAGAAHADSPTGVLVLPTQVAGNVPDRGRLQHELDARVARAVEASGRVTKPTGPLTSAEASCREAECLGKIAEGAAVQIVVGARVTADRGSPPSYKVVVDRYDRDKPGAVRQEIAECSVCTEAETADRVEQVVGLVLPKPRVETAAPVATAPAEVVQPTPVHPSKTPLYIGIGVSSALTVGGLVMIGLGGAAHQIDGHTTNDFRDVYDTGRVSVGLLAAGAVVTVGGVVGLAISATKLKRAH